MIRIWVTGCTHVTTDGASGRYPLRDSVEDLGFFPDLVFLLGDVGSTQGFQTTGEDYVEYDIEPYRRILYPLKGNHDCGDGDFSWWNGIFLSVLEHVDKPYAIVDAGGSYLYEAYEITLGRSGGEFHCLFVDDRNDVAPNAGMAGVGGGGYPAGAIHLDTKTWLTGRATAYSGESVFVFSHQGVVDTCIGTFAADDTRWHGTTGGGNLGAIYYDTASGVLTGLGSIAVTAWASAHTHFSQTEMHEDPGCFEEVSGVYHWRTGGNTLHHGASDAMSTVLTLESGSAWARVDWYYHGSAAGGAPPKPPKGQPVLTRWIPLPQAFLE